MDTSSGPGGTRPTILLLSGTSEGPQLARALLAAGFAVRATVTRPEAIDSLFGALAEQVTVEARGFTAETLTAFLAAGAADLVVDATHPFAVRITQLTRNVCGQLGVPLVRYERPDWTPPAGTLFADSFPDAASRLPALGRRIMLTIGAKQLKHFAHLHNELTLFARVLPGDVSLAQARAAGFLAEQVIQQRPPFTREENRALFARLQADLLVTKASGREGGVVEKMAAACDLNMKVLMIRRPLLEGPEAVGSIAAAVTACQDLTR